MQGDHICVAGYLRDGTCIRPLFRWKPLTESWVWQKGSVVIRPYTEVELDLLEHKPHPPHSEDWWIDPTYYRLVRILKPDQRTALLQKIEDSSIESIFGAPIHQENGWFIHAGQGTRSLGTIKVTTIERVGYAAMPDGRWDYRIAFTDGVQTQYKLAVTDLAFRCYLDYARQHEGRPPDKAAEHLTTFLHGATVYLRIGLARGWEKYPDRCHLQITGVYSFPDYLDGKCFADFNPQPGNAAADIEVPF
jgi:hypothetical protein